MTNTYEMFHVIKDPVHGTMQFNTLEDNWIKPFIDSPNFQRLRHIKQMGMGDYIFPGAVHTRFNHCLGCCYNARQIAHKVELTEDERHLVMVACLLHDIGHGPFSHAFEDMFHKKMIRHEAWTPFFLKDYHTDEFFSAYNKRNPNHHMTSEKFTMIEEMIMHKGKTKNVMADIVSSQLDADRLDYLLRDSHFCGVAYGEFDSRWMMHSLLIVDSKQGKRLGLSYKGIGVVEHYLMARRLMARNIYQHQKKLALEYYLVKFFSSLAESLEDHSPYEEVKTTRLGSFLLAANHFNQKIVNAKNPEEMKQRFLAENYSNYKELCDYDVFAVVKLLAHTQNDHATAKIADCLHNRHMPKIIRLENIDINAADDLVSEFRDANKAKIQDWQFALIKTPHQSYSIGDDPILIANDQGQVRPLDEISQMIHAISDKPEHTAFLCIDTKILDDAAVSAFIKDGLKLARRETVD